MLKRRLVWLGLVTGLVLVSLVIAVRWSASHDPLRQAAELVKVGMTEAEVVATLGRKADFPELRQVVNRPDGNFRVQDYWWLEPTGQIIVTFQDPEMKVLGCRYSYVSPSLLGRLRAWLGW